MIKLNPLLAAYDTVLLDMDGVITSEEIYWETAALTVWEFLNSHLYYGTDTIDPVALTDQVKELRAQVFLNDAVIKNVKNHGLNNNWDLAWFVIGCALVYKTRDFTEIAQHLDTLFSDNPCPFTALSAKMQQVLGMSEEESAHLGSFWKSVQLCFQEWFVGSELFPQYWNHPVIQPGKAGLSFREEPLVDREPLLKLLQALGKEKRLGIGTGRPRIEAITPLKTWGVINAFTEDAIVTYQEIVKTQKSLQSVMPNLVLNKPHPYMFLKGVFGEQYDDLQLINGEYPKDPCKKTLVIGDAACDLFAAKRAGCDFLAVLTGVAGENARSFFEQENADFILHNILELLAS